MARLKDLTEKREKISSGHRLCAGCGASIVVRQVTAAIDGPAVIACATGCLEVSTTIYPYTAWNDSFIHSAFENAAATISGVEAAYKALKRKGKIRKNFKFVAFGGDGGTYDIGFQSLSGAFERGHDFVYVCYDNGAYMNTGIQRSSATPFGASTTTTPAGKRSFGKIQQRKDLTQCMVAHHGPYVAQASPSHWNDLMKKAEKAFAAEGPAFLNVLAPCPRGWRIPSEDGIEMARIAVETCYWPLYEVENGKWNITHKPREKRPVVDWLKPQGRFSHLFKPENEPTLTQVQEQVDHEWEMLLKREQCL